MIVSRDTSGGSYRPLAVPFQVYRDQVSRDLKRSLESHAEWGRLGRRRHDFLSFAT